MTEPGAPDEPRPEEPQPGDETLDEKVRFLARIDPFHGLPRDYLQRVATSLSDLLVPEGRSLLVEGGLPGTQLYVVRAGSFEITHKEVVLDILAPGAVFGHPTLLTGQAPEFTTRAREDSFLYCIPSDIAIVILSRPEGVRFVARTLRDRLIQAARTMRALPDVRTRAVTSLIRGAPVFCGPETSIREAAELMARDKLSAVLVEGRDGLGIVTDVDIRDKMVVGGISPEAPVSTIASSPVTTVRAEALAAEAALAMMESGVNHLPVIEASGRVLGILSASSLMTLDALSPFALRQVIQAAPGEDDVAEAAADVPKLFVDLIDAGVGPMSLMRIVTVLADAMTSRLIQLSLDRLGRPPTAWAWLALGSSARSELTLASDQDSGIAYEDADDPAVDEFFRRVAEDVNAGMDRCGFPTDKTGVAASNREWRMSMSEWVGVFTRCLSSGSDNDRLMQAAIGFDFRGVAGDLPIVPALMDIIRQAPRHVSFLGGLMDLGTEIPTPLGFRQRLTGPVDIKRSGLLPIQNLARYYAFARGITAPTTIERLVAVQEAGAPGSDSSPMLQEAFRGMSQIRLQHHADALRQGRRADNAIDTTLLTPLNKVSLQEALRVVYAAQRRLPQRLAPL